jgi:hypothetical protein
MNRVVAGTAIAGLLMMASACSDDSGSGGAVAPAARSLSAMLGWLPESLADSATTASFADLDELRGGSSAGSVEDDVRLLDERSGHGQVVPSAFSGSILEPEFAEYAGFDSRDIAAWVEAGALPDLVTVLVGRFDAGRIEKALRSSPGGDALVVQHDGDVVTFLLGEQGANDIASRSAIRPIGGALVLALSGNVLVWGSEAASVTASVSGHATGASMAGRAAVAAIAAVVEPASPDSGGFGTPTAGESWRLAGWGESYSDAGTTITLALYYPDAAAATAAATAFRAHVANDASAVDGTPWADVVTVVAAGADGVVMTATLTTTRSLLMQRNFQRLDNLLQF